MKRCITDGFFLPEQVELAPKPVKVSPQQSDVSVHVHLLMWFLLFLCMWDKISGKLSETCKPALLCFWIACKPVRTFFQLSVSHYLDFWCNEFHSQHAFPGSTIIHCMISEHVLTFGYCWTGMRTRSESLMFLLLMMSRYFFTSPSFFISSPSHFPISARKEKTNKTVSYS